MAESLVEQLDLAVETIRTSPDARPRVSAYIEPLVAIALELRDLPREEFKVRLRDDLQRRIVTMTTSTAVKPVEFREGFHTVTPYLAVRETEELIEFVKEVFGAEGAIFGTGSEGSIHAEYRIGDSVLMIGGGKNWQGTPTPTALHVFVEDVDAIYQRSLDAGATSMVGPIEDHGERVAGVKDVAGNQWYIARRLSGSHTAEGLRSVNVYLHPQGAAQMIEFLKLAFGAEEVIVHRAEAEGPVLHAKIRIGDSVIEMGEAHGPFQPMPTMFYLYVDNVDEWYRRALKGGANSFSEPANQPYGDRTAAVTDPFGNTWYMGTPIQNIGS
ncbi:MAG: VOC family protein [Pyrinomonadaceae bacterium]